VKWITRERVKLDRVACPWLIKKFVDKDAQFIFVPPDKVMDEAKRLDAIPYDVKNVELGHHGKECSFEAILKKHKLTDDPALVPGGCGREVACRMGLELSVFAITPAEWSRHRRSVSRVHTLRELYPTHLDRKLTSRNYLPTLVPS
jgi:hypothetical protein